MGTKEAFEVTMRPWEMVRAMFVNESGAKAPAAPGVRRQNIPDKRALFCFAGAAVAFVKAQSD